MRDERLIGHELQIFGGDLRERLALVLGHGSAEKVDAALGDVGCCAVALALGLGPAQRPPHVVEGQLPISMTLAEWIQLPN